MNDLRRCGTWIASVLVLGAASCFNPSSTECDTDGCDDTGSGDTTAGGPTSTSSDPSMTSTVGDPTSVGMTLDGDTTSTTELTSDGPDPASTSDGGCPRGTENCSCVEGLECDPGLTCVDDECLALGALHPVAPTADNFMWQNVQTDFVYDSGLTCTGMVTIAMGDQAVCFVASDGELRCAGRVFATTWGPSFTGTGQMNVEQVSIRPTFNAADGNGMCLLADGVVRCMGRNNNNGVYGTGGTGDVAVLTQWGNLGGLTRMGTGTWDQLCAMSGAGDLYCAGYDFGPTPTLQQSGVDTFWISTFGDVLPDDADVWRPASGRTECTVRATGLSCPGASFGPPGEVVDGTTIEGAAGPDAVCWLTSAGDVQCSGASQITYFEEGRVIALAANQYTDSLCAVYDDASLWCVGSNDQGKLGTGDTLDVLVETEVQPPGSVRVNCQ